MHCLMDLFNLFIKMRSFCIITVFIQLVPVIFCEGVFELGLLSLHNELGKDLYSNCCSGTESGDGSCSGACHTYFRVCLKQFQTNIDTESSCTYGSKQTQVLGDNSIDLKSHADLKAPLSFPFSFAWPGTFTLIVEAWHNTSSAPENGEESHKGLIVRLAEAKLVKVSESWTRESHSSGESVLKLEYRVVCSEHYYGDNCMQFCKPKDDQYGHFQCTADGKKRCLPGWQGNTCDKALCSSGCHPEHGECTAPGECRCKLGWIGTDCDQCQRYPGCLKGSCSKPWECLCDEGWGGIFCNQDLNFCTHHKPCQNGATCTNSGEGHYTCTCEPGYTGTNCERKIQDCSLEPCLNGGACKEESSNYTCTCFNGFSGRHCQISASTCSEDPCRNGASCIDQPRGYTCLCLPGWQGNNCDIEKNECDSQPCLNDGRCIDDVDGFQCICPVGFDGSTCEVNTNDCVTNPCLNGGICKDEINAFKCQCTPGFIGTLCQYNIDDCLKRPCANGGTCFDVTNGFQCLCRPGFRGKDCSIDVNECNSSPCRNGASCVDLVDQYQCTCPTCFSGTNCEIKDQLCYDNLPLTSTHNQVQQPWISIGLPILIVILLALVLVMFLVVICLYRRTLNRKKCVDTQVERQNASNKAKESHKYYNNNLSLINSNPVAFVHPYTVAKVDNRAREGKAMNQEEEKPRTQLSPIDINTFAPHIDMKLCKSVEKIHDHRDRRRSRADLPAPIKSDTSRDSGLGSPSGSEEYGALSPPLKSMEGNRTCVALRVPLAHAVPSSALTRQHHNHIRSTSRSRPLSDVSTFETFNTQV